MTFRSAALLLLLTLLALARPAHAAQGIASCTNYLPDLPGSTISTPGTWCLRSDMLSFTGGSVVVTVATDNVTIDCNDHSIDVNIGWAEAVRAVDQFNVTVRNCQLRNFGYVAIDLESTTATSGGRYLVENNEVVATPGTGIRVDGDGSVVRHNQIEGLPSTTYSQPQSYGIYTTWSVNVTDNTITGLTMHTGSDGGVYGIYTLNNASGSIDGNSVSALDSNKQGHAFGIHNENSGRVTIRDNTFSGNGLAGGVGINCTDVNGRAVHNMINGFTTGIQFCNAASDNDISP